MREFKIENAKGENFDMNRVDAFFVQPEHMGTQKEMEFVQIGNEFKEIRNVQSQVNPSGTMSFKKYDQFEEFIKILRYPPFKLWYKPRDQWFFKKVLLGMLGKGEISNDTNRLECEIVLNSLTQWKKESTFYKCKESSGAGKTYPYSYQYAYTEDEIGSVKINNLSGQSQYCKIVINGPAQNPAWTLIKNGVMVENGRLRISIEQEERIVVNGLPTEREIAVYSKENEFIKNIYETSDFYTQRFITIPEGECTISFSNETQNVLSAYVEMEEAYECV